jgi:hypothetical protein
MSMQIPDLPDCGHATGDPHNLHEMLSWFFNSSCGVIIVAIGVGVLVFELSFKARA